MECIARWLVSYAAMLWATTRGATSVISCSMKGRCRQFRRHLIQPSCSTNQCFCDAIAVLGARSSSGPRWSGPVSQRCRTCVSDPENFDLATPSPGADSRLNRFSPCSMSVTQSCFGVAGVTSSGSSLEGQGPQRCRTPLNRDQFRVAGRPAIGDPPAPSGPGTAVISTGQWAESVVARPGSHASGQSRVT
jgi:hypothetical protein